MAAAEYPNYRPELMENLLEKQSIDKYFSRKLEADLFKFNTLNLEQTSLPSINVQSYMIHFILGSILTLPYSNLNDQLLHVEQIFIKWSKVGSKRNILKVYFLRNSAASKKRKNEIIYRSFDFSDDQYTLKKSMIITDQELTEVIKKMQLKGFDPTKYSFKNVKHFSITKPPHRHVYTVNRNNNYMGVEFFDNVFVAGDENSPFCSIDSTLTRKQIKNHGKRWKKMIKLVNNKATAELNEKGFVIISKKDILHNNLDEDLKDFFNKDNKKSLRSIEMFFKKMAGIFQYYDSKFDSKFSASRVDHGGFVHGSLIINFEKKFGLDSFIQNEQFRYHDKMTLVIQNCLTNPVQRILAEPIVVEFKDQGSDRVTNLAVKNVKNVIFPSYLKSHSKFCSFAAVNLIAQNDPSRAIQLPLKNQLHYNSLLTKIIDHVQLLCSEVFIKHIFENDLNLDAINAHREQFNSAEERIKQEIDLIKSSRKLHSLRDIHYVSRYIIGEIGSRSISRYQAYVVKIPTEHPHQDSMTTFVLQTKFETFNIHIHVHESVEKKNWRKVDKIIAQMQPNRITDRVKHVVKVNLKIHAKNHPWRLDVQEVSIQDTFQLDVNVQVKKFDPGTTTHPLVEIPSVKTADFISRAQEVVRGSLNVVQIRDFFRSVKNYIITPNDFHAITKGLFESSLSLYYAAYEINEITGVGHLTIPIQEYLSSKRKLDKIVLITFATLLTNNRHSKRKLYAEHLNFLSQMVTDQTSVASHIIMFDRNEKKAENILKCIHVEKDFKSRDLTHLCGISRKRRNLDFCSELLSVIDEEENIESSKSVIKLESGLQKSFMRIATTAALANHGIIAENIVANIIEGQYKGACMNLGFLSSSFATNYIANKISMFGSKLNLLEKSVIGNAMRLSSPFVRRLSSGLMIYDLVSSIQKYRAGNSDAGLNVVADSSFLAIDTAEIGIEIAETLGFIGGVSSITGPIGLALGAMIIVGTEIYQTVKLISKVKAELHLSWYEKLKLGLFSLVHIGVNSYIKKLQKEKLEMHQEEMLLNLSSIIMSHENIYQYITPLELNNEVYLNQKFWSNKWYKFPITQSSYYSKNLALSCLPKNTNDQSGTANHIEVSYWYICKNAIGLRRTRMKSQDAVTIIELGNGNDVAHGLPNSPNIFILGDGQKHVTAGEENDTFILLGKNITGILDGKSGFNTVDLHHLPEHVLLFFSSKVETLFLSLKAHIFISVVVMNIHHIIGRFSIADTVFCTNKIKQLNLGGGLNENSFDFIRILDQQDFHVKINVANFTQILNDAISGNFVYVCDQCYGSKLKLKNMSFAQHTFLFMFKSRKIQELCITDDSKTLEIVWDENSDYKSSGMKVIGLSSSCSLHFDDGFILRVTNEKLIAMLNIHWTVDQIVNEYSIFSERFGILLVAFSTLDNVTIVFGNNIHNGSRKATILQNDPMHTTYMFSGPGENIFIINPPSGVCNKSLPRVIDVIIHKKNLSTNVVDLRNLYTAVDSLPNMRVKNHVTYIGFNEWLISLFTANETNNSFYAVIATIRLVNFSKHDILLNFNLIGAMPMKLKRNLQLFNPLPLTFNSNETKIIITVQDVDYDAQINIKQTVANLQSFSTHNGDLIITDVVHHLSEKSANCSFRQVTFSYCHSVFCRCYNKNIPSSKAAILVFKSFYSSNSISCKLKTLKIKFRNRKFSLNDPMFDKLNVYDFASLNFAIN